ncbi:MAG: type II toxin-antitoxin system HicB family antitoxin [Planctomycetota bacterium]|nr:type II toxin-antitoxin system HicB family antitoxin [Planctomycetota bacterium]MDI6787197.1 type II toxin-antitoxin system HicB family antitoxin [Planctomycetota bacterium]
MSINYTMVIVKLGSWYAGYVKELPGAHSQGKTIAEVKENIKEAIRMILASNYRHFVKGQKKVLEEKIAVTV